MKNKYDTFGKNNANINIANLTEMALYFLNKGLLDDNEKSFIEYYCQMVINYITYTKNEQKIYDFYIKNILNNLYDKDTISEKHIRTAAQYLAMKKIKELNIKVDFKIMPDLLYTLKYNFPSISSCENRESDHSIIRFRNSIFSKTIDNQNHFDKQKLFSLLVIIYHEIVHANQNHIICEQLDSQIEDKNVLIWIKELLIDDFDHQYYDKNYQNIPSECDAYVKSRQMAIDDMHNYFAYMGLEFLDKIEQQNNQYQQNIQSLKHYDPATGYKEEGDALIVMDSYIDKIALQCPYRIYDKLDIQYHKDGQRRSSDDLINSYYKKRELIESSFKKENPLYKEKLRLLDELYVYLITSAKCKETADQLKSKNSKVIQFKSKIK